LNPLDPLLAWRRCQPDARELYGAIVAQARLPVFYQSFGVPDTLEGRFAVLAAHLFVVLERLHALGSAGAALAQALADRFSEDMETVLRELGVGDMGVPKKMRKLARSSAALLRAYGEGHAAGEEAFAATIASSLPLEGAAAEAAAARLASYLTDAARLLASRDLAALEEGRVAFPEAKA
jgi:cytochrome b pre-mRNA-processing protein 3